MTATIESPNYAYPARSRGRRGPNLEKAGWVFMRASGVVLVVLDLAVPAPAVDEDHQRALLRRVILRDQEIEFLARVVLPDVVEVLDQVSGRSGGFRGHG